MKLKILFSALVCLMTSSCASNSTATGGSEVPFVEAKNYYLRNDVKSAPPAVITSQTEFDNYFGIAAVMGKNGQPTTIDFSKQNVIAVTVPETDRSTNIVPISLCGNDDGKLVLSYKIVEKEKTSYTMLPVLLLVVDKSFGNNVALRCQR